MFTIYIRDNPLRIFRNKANVKMFKEEIKLFFVIKKLYDILRISLKSREMKYIFFCKDMKPKNMEHCCALFKLKTCRCRPVPCWPASRRTCSQWGSKLRAGLPCTSHPGPLGNYKTNIKIYKIHLYYLIWPSM